MVAELGFLELGFLDDIKAKSLVPLNEDPNYEKLPENERNNVVFVAAIERSPGEFYLYGCKNQGDIEEVLNYYSGTKKWYRLIPVKHTEF